MGQANTKQHENCDRMVEVLQSSSACTPVVNRTKTSSKTTNTTASQSGAAAPSTNAAPSECYSRTFQNAHWIQPTSSISLTNQNVNMLHSNPAFLGPSNYVLPLDAFAAVLGSYQLQNRHLSPQSRPEEVGNPGSHRQSQHQHQHQQHPRPTKVEILSSIFNQSETDSHKSESPLSTISLPEVSNTAEPNEVTSNHKREFSETDEGQLDESKLPQKKRKLPPSLLAQLGKNAGSELYGQRKLENCNFQKTFSPNRASNNKTDPETVITVKDFEEYLQSNETLKVLQNEYDKKREVVHFSLQNVFS